MSERVPYASERRERIYQLDHAFIDGQAGKAEFEELRDMLTAENLDHRAAALNAMGTAGTHDDELADDVVDVMLAHCIDQPKRIRGAAAFNLKVTGRARTGTVIRPALDTLHEWLGDESTREDAAFALLQIGYDLPQLLEPYVEDLRLCLDDDAARRSTVGVLQAIARESPEAFHPPFDDLERCLDDDRRQVRLSAVRTFASIADRHPVAARPALEETFRIMSRADYLRNRARHLCLGTLEKMGVVYAGETGRIVAVLRPHVDRNVVEAFEALATIATVHPRSVVPAIEELQAGFDVADEFYGKQTDSDGLYGEQTDSDEIYGKEPDSDEVKSFREWLVEVGVGQIGKVITAVKESVARDRINDDTPQSDDERRVCAACEALEAIARVQPDAVRPAIEENQAFLEGRLEDDRRRICTAAARLLLTSGTLDPETVTEVEEICRLLLDDVTESATAEALELRDTEEPPLVSRAATGLLVRLGLLPKGATVGMPQISRFGAAERAVRSLVAVELCRRLDAADSETERPAVVSALGTIATEDRATAVLVYNGLVACFEDDDPAVRARAPIALWRLIDAPHLIPPEPDFSPFEDLLDDEDEAVRLAAAATLLELDSEQSKAIDHDREELRAYVHTSRASATHD